jgi:hypothetical protein
MSRKLTIRRTRSKFGRNAGNASLLRENGVRDTGSDRIGVSRTKVARPRGLKNEARPCRISQVSARHAAHESRRH